MVTVQLVKRYERTTLKSGGTRRGGYPRLRGLGPRAIREDAGRCLLVGWRSDLRLKPLETRREPAGTRSERELTRWYRGETRLEAEGTRWERAETSGSLESFDALAAGFPCLGVIARTCS